MKIEGLEKKYQAFYAPGFQILVEGKDLLAEKMEVTSVQVDNILDGADHFSFTIDNGFDLTNREFNWLMSLLAFGKKVKIHLGYTDIKKLELMHFGLITSVSVDFPSGGVPQITVSGFDFSHCMMQGRQSRSWDSKKDSQVAREIASEHNLKSDVQDSQVIHPRVEQTQESNYHFLKRLADRNGFELYVFNDTLFFKEPSCNESAAVTLEWGKGLISFSPDVNLAKQIAAVEVRGWDMKSKKEIVGKAKKGDELGRDSGRRSGADVMASIYKEDTVLRIRQPVYSQQEADRQAKAILRKRSEIFVKGSGQSVGIPEIRADTNIELLGLGKVFSKTYYIEKATHTINASGYKTAFNVKDTTI
ncbi:hypothetical protein D1BOALGB6SA_7201 [Olavius sp. associated proteobacterium Delta 1]|nr:hypothetical protein D1BOALGB6SA_7201 [Olavius sp. associated proteobacterium Delta 1]